MKVSYVTVGAEARTGRKWVWCTHTAGRGDNAVITPSIDMGTNRPCPTSLDLGLMHTWVGRRVLELHAVGVSLPEG